MGIKVASGFSEKKLRWCRACARSQQGARYVESSTGCEDCAAKRPHYGLRSDPKVTPAQGRPEARESRKVARLPVESAQLFDRESGSAACARPTIWANPVRFFVAQKRVRWCGACAKGHPEAFEFKSLKGKCVDCGVKNKGYGPADKPRPARWCKVCLIFSRAVELCAALKTPPPPATHRTLVRGEAGHAVSLAAT